jgi:positive phototaxis protein PixI
MQLPSLLIPQTQQKSAGEPFLNLQLTPIVQAVLSMEQAVEALVIPTERVNPMPNMPAWILGLLNQRTKIYWVIDLPLLLGLPPVQPFAQRYSIILLRQQQQTLAIAVPEVIGILRIEPAEIVSPLGNVAEGLVPYLRGYLPQAPTDGADQKTLWVLDPIAILQTTAHSFQHAIG